LIDLPLFIPTPANRRIRKAIELLDEFLYSIISKRRKAQAGDDLLAVLLSFRDDKGQPMSERQLRDEVLITFFAGHETTAQLLTWTWYLLARHADVERRFHDELAAVLKGRSPKAEDIPSLTYLRMILDETLRLYSPVAMMARDAVKEDEIDKYQIPARSIIAITPFITHRHPDYWEKPDAFWPDHFTPNRVRERPRYAYLPFGAGRRICLGKHFALLEAALVMAEIGQRYRVKLVDDQGIGIHWSGTLRPDRDILVSIQER
jgi:cytochrome P450